MSQALLTVINTLACVLIANVFRRTIEVYFNLSLLASMAGSLLICFAFCGLTMYLFRRRI